MLAITSPDIKRDAHVENVTDAGVRRHDEREPARHVPHRPGGLPGDERQRRRPHPHGHLGIRPCRRLRAVGLRGNQDGCRRPDRSIAWEGMRHGIKANALAPAAFDSRMYAAMDPDGDAALTGRPPELEASLENAEFMGLYTASRVAPLALALVHPSCPVTAEVYSATGGYYCRFAISHTEGVVLGAQPTVEAWWRGSTRSAAPTRFGTRSTARRWCGVCSRSLRSCHRCSVDSGQHADGAFRGTDERSCSRQFDDSADLGRQIAVSAGTRNMLAHRRDDRRSAGRGRQRLA